MSMISEDGIIETAQAQIYTSDYALKKRHNTAETSKESFMELLKSGQIKKEKDIVIACLKEHQPINTRQLAYTVGIEKTNIGRTLHGLVKDGVVKVAYEDKCPITKKRVGYYTLIDWQSQGRELHAA